MAVRRPLVLVGGEPQELPTVDLAAGLSVVAYFKTDGTETTLPANVAQIPTTLRFVEADGGVTWLPSNVGAGGLVIEASRAKSFFMAGW